MVAPPILNNISTRQYRTDASDGLLTLLLAILAPRLLLEVSGHAASRQAPIIVVVHHADLA